MRRYSSTAAAAASALAFALAAASPAAAATITIINVDPAGVGFNDPTPAVPVGGNPGTTLGAQRLFAFQHAAGVWAASLDSPVEILVQASNPVLSCTPTSAVLGSAGPIQVAANFTGAILGNTWYHIALANKLAGVDLIPGPPGTSADDVIARFNRQIGQPGCLDGAFWYFGVDHDEPPGGIDYAAVVLHELGHGVGFSSTTNVSTGQHFMGFPGAYDHCIFDDTQGLFWPQMTPAQRQASAINCRNVVWSCPMVDMFYPFILDLGYPRLAVTAPVGIAGDYEVGAASFGPPLAAPGVTGEIELVNDGVGTPTDGCEPLIGFTPGRIALIDRGTCSFSDKVANAEAAGASAAIVADNVAGCPPPGLGGTAAIGIPSSRVTLADGNTIKANLPGVTANLGVDPSRRAGVHANGHVLLYSPNPVQPGSSISHWDTSASPNLLMEPAITPDLTDDLDLTPMALADTGWMLLSTCGNDVREGLEKCDGTDLFGQTCRTLGFDGGSLACASDCSDFDTSACVTCDRGRTDGRWNLPAGPDLGWFGGSLSSGGLPVYKVVGSLTPVTPAKGILTGIIYDGVGSDPDFFLDGEYAFSGVNFGTFGSKIFEFGTGASVGSFEGDWSDDPSFSIIGSFGGRWEICQ